MFSASELTHIVKMAMRNILLINIYCFLFCQSAFVDNLGKCGIDDGECQKNLLQSVLRDIGKTGVPDYGIPPTDPYILKNVTVNVRDIVQITMVDGVAKGAKDCIVDKIEANVDDGHAIMELTCDLTIKGRYSIKGSSPLIQNLLGGSEIRGDGNGKVAIEKFHIKFEYLFNIRRRDGEIYIEHQHKDLKISYTLGKVTFGADHVLVGDNEASGLIVPLMNENWKFVIQNFGKPFLDKAMDIIYEHTHKFFGVVPTKYYITDDLTPYIKED